MAAVGGHKSGTIFGLVALQLAENSGRYVCGKNSHVEIKHMWILSKFRKTAVTFET